MNSRAKVAGTSELLTHVSQSKAFSATRGPRPSVAGVTSWNMKSAPTSLASPSDYYRWKRIRGAVGDNQLQGMKIPPKYSPTRSTGSLTRRTTVVQTPTETYQELTELTSGDGVYVLRKPVMIRVSDADHDGVYVVTDGFSSTYGSGETPSEAIRDYSVSLFYEFEDLQENEDALGVALQRELASLRRYIDRR